MVEPRIDQRRRNVSQLRLQPTIREDTRSHARLVLRFPNQTSGFLFNDSHSSIYFRSNASERLSFITNVDRPREANPSHCLDKVLVYIYT